MKSKAKRLASRTLPAMLILLTALFAGCNGTDCPLNNTVRARYAFYESGTGKAITIPDTLSVSALPKDTTILNRAIGIASITLPLSYVQNEDTLLFKFRTKSGQVCDTVCISHTNIPHFASLDCGTSIFHEIKDVRINRRTATAEFPTVIDSITIANSKVNYDETENFKVYLSTH
jgi:hypothetical protein